MAGTIEVYNAIVGDQNNYKTSNSDLYAWCFIYVFFFTIRNELNINIIENNTQVPAKIATQILCASFHIHFKMQTDTKRRE